MTPASAQPKPQPECNNCVFLSTIGKCIAPKDERERRGCDIPLSALEHCEHEPICHLYRDAYFKAEREIKSCGYGHCTYDTRTRPHTPAPSTVVEDITFEGAAIVQAARAEAARAATLSECERIYGLFHEVEQLHLNGMSYPDLYNEMVERIKTIHTEPLSKDCRNPKHPSQHTGDEQE